MPTTAILELSIRHDADAWEAGCKSLGITNGIEPILSAHPSENQFRQFFASSPNWIFCSGHLGYLELSNNDCDTKVQFDSDKVDVTLPDGTFTIKKDSAQFGLAKNCLLTMWAGCSVARDPTDLSTLFHLFGQHTLLGYSRSTGWPMSANMFGKGTLKKHFFANLDNKELTPENIRNAWIDAGIAGYRGTVTKDFNEETFTAVDPDGQIWFPRKGKLTPGKKIR